MVSDKDGQLMSFDGDGQMVYDVEDKKLDSDGGEQLM
jgi:hypothetical protein